MGSTPPADPAAPGAPAPDEGVARAGRWLSALEALAARAAHELNNALNGALVNLEVVKLRAQPGQDAGAVARFAEAAAGQLEAAVALASALVALTRAPRTPADVRAELARCVTLLAPAVAHDGVVLSAPPGDPAPTAADGHAVRLAIAEALLAVAAPGARAVESGGPDRADEPARDVRCTLDAAPAPVLALHGGASAALDAELTAALSAAGIACEPDQLGLVLRFPPLP